MKRLFSLLFVLILVFNLSACGESGTSSNLETSVTNNNSDIVDQITEEVFSGIESSKEFVVGEELKKLNSGEILLPLNDVKASILDSKVIKSKILDINNPEDFVYVGGSYEFYKYQYIISISGSIDNKYSGKYIRLKFDFPSGTMQIQTFFKGDVGDLGSYWYDSKLDLSGVSGCVFKVESDGSFKGEITALSNENINEYMITGVGITY